MISRKARSYIDASVPVLREYGLAITRTFYRNMFAAHPEFSNLFNMGNQANGAQQQSLASAVFAYATNIENAAALDPVIRRIAHKHASVGIKAEHYPIVGHYLLGAIQEVLGEAATPAIIAAWDEAYAELATALINIENALYRQTQTVPGELRDMRVTKIRVESEDIKAFVLEAVDGQAISAFKPGQYLSVAVKFEDGATQLRQYSLSDAPHPQYLQISVKREQSTDNKPAGRVSNWLHKHIQLGSLIKVTHPFGDFTPDTESTNPIVLLSAGVGITPMISVVNRIAQVNPVREVIFAHAVKSLAWHAHRSDLDLARKRMPNLQTLTFYKDLAEADHTDPSICAGRMLVSRLPVWPLDQASVYLCGPVKFMQEQWRALLEAGVPAARLHREVFGPELLNYLD
ncbi:NO-inducible flavohemoprotein [Chitinolyticbacter meiyuanensis]|uniref:NO-inducible flavohemoprotein n=1 Tax=Chitinolyticbacter meiyuanensis TaxID=682798 RepID=UPI0011E5C950|nr:NO-inducible flavohemoprotein [Chitinolyticbacter meiyuanensis]